MSSTDVTCMRDGLRRKADVCGRKSGDGGVQREIEGSWEEVLVEEDLTGGDLGPHTHALRKAIQSSDSYSTLAKQVLLNQLDGLEHMAIMMSSLERAQPGRLSSPHIEVLEHFYDFLCTNITMDDPFFAALIRRGVISSGMAEEMYAVGTRRRQCATLLDLLKVLGEKSYKGFLGALRDTNQEFLVETIKLKDVPSQGGPDIASDCPSFDRNVSVRSEHVVLPIACYPKSGRSILLDIFVPDNGKPLLDENGKPQSRMSKVRTMALIKNQVRLCRELFAEIIFDSMIEDEVFTPDITEALFMVGARHRMNQVLLYILPFYGDEAFDSLVNGLKKTGQSGLAILLEDYVLQNQDLEEDDITGADQM